MQRDHLFTFLFAVPENNDIGLRHLLKKQLYVQHAATCRRKQKALNDTDVLLVFILLLLLPLPDFGINYCLSVCLSVILPLINGFLSKLNTCNLQHGWHYFGGEREGGGGCIYIHSSDTANDACMRTYVRMYVRTYGVHTLPSLLGRPSLSCACLRLYYYTCRQKIRCRLL